MNRTNSCLRLRLYGPSEKIKSFLKCIPCHPWPAVLIQVEVAYFQLEVSNFNSALAKHKTQNVMEGGDYGGYTTPVKGSDNESYSSCDDVPCSVDSEEDGGEAQDNEKGVESSSSAKEKEDSADEKECNAAAGTAPGSCAADEEGAEEEGNASEIGVRKRKYVKRGWCEWAELGCWDRIQLLGS